MQTGLNIYFCGSIRGGRHDAALYREIINELKQYGTVLTEHVGNEVMLGEEISMDDKEIHDRDVEWLQKADFLVCEVTTPSLGVGYEIGRAIGFKKPILCLYREIEGKRPSAMISGCSDVTFSTYTNFIDTKSIISNFIQIVKNTK
eukprot:TRINITY_DN11569_c0_g1_i1.p1 TRINITY_DN11569_c0_g1~~TRINITY_DN11569_c0_g1_i1.p1  ORF type:complete len:146 (-),score=21.37 TRINITY_DN11569_c0_g1_i1:34-471(-)